MVLRGAKKVQKAINSFVPDAYEAFLFTAFLVDIGDKLTWKGIDYSVKEIERIYDVYELSYRIAKLVNTPKPFYAGIGFSP
jgi:hypothetical protein